MEDRRIYCIDSDGSKVVFEPPLPYIPVVKEGELKPTATYTAWIGAPDFRLSEELAVDEDRLLKDFLNRSAKNSL